ncbi:MAG: guanylate kinase [Flavobacteriaceae bacterium]
MNAGKLIVLSAPSGSGKTTLVQYLLKQDLALGFSISATSRPMRGAEIEGVDYYFLSPEQFENKINEQAFLEYEQVYRGVYYGTLNSEITRLWEQEQHILFDIDVQGGLTIKEKFPDQTLALFIQPPSVEELEARLRKRATDDEVKIQERLHKAQTELEYAAQFDQIIINDDLETAKKEIVQCVKHFIES